ncbi:MAG: zinc-dependent alcohol dehydrogenase family protein [Parasphingorhabdus sp.]
MKAMLLNSFGPDAPFEMSDIAEPTTKAGEVLVKIAATSINTVDTMIRHTGESLAPLSPALPALLGMDLAGIVTEVGEGVSGFTVGDEVYGCAGGLADLPGALAEHIAVDAELIAHKPKNLSMKEAAALPLVGITAFEGLQRATAQSGQKILVHGGVGGVGHVAVQLAKQAGADVFATISDDQMAGVIEDYGATPINYKTTSVEDYVNKHTGGAGFNVVFDSVGGANMLNSFEAAALNGQVATTVSMLELDLTTAHFKGLSIHVVFMLIPMLHNHQREEHSVILTRLAEIADSGELKPLVDEKEFALEQVADAYSYLASGKAVGKVVIEI